MSLCLQPRDLLQAVEAERRQRPAVILLIVMPIANDSQPRDSRLVYRQFRYTARRDIDLADDAAASLVLCHVALRSSFACSRWLADHSVSAPAVQSPQRREKQHPAQGRTD